MARVGTAAGVTEAWIVERIVPGGEGLARTAGGQIAFVPGGLPGDHVAPETLEQHRGFQRATTWRLLSPSPDRVEPPCPIAKDCGGCDLMHLSRPAQLRAKGSLLADALRRLGHIELAPPLTRVTTAGPDLGYRHRVRLQVGTDGTLGFFGRRSRALVPVERCAVATEAINGALEALRRGGGRALSAMLTVELSAAPHGEPLVATGNPRPGAAGSALLALERALGAAGRAWVPGASRGPAPEQRFPLPGGAELRACPQTFSQVNWPVNLRLVTDLLAAAQARAVTRFVDLYAGAGNFALPLLAAGATGLAVERSRTAVRLGERSARARGLDPQIFRASAAEDFAPRLAIELPEPDLVLLDPPRAGSKAVLGAVTAARPRWIALVACDPAALARDLRILLERGCSLGPIAAYDMFPHTHHLETVAWVEGTPRAAAAPA